MERVFVVARTVAEDWHLVSLDATTGQEQWKVPVTVDYSHYRTIAREKAVIAGDGGGNVTAADPRTGQILWARQVVQAPNIVGGAVYSATDDQLFFVEKWIQDHTFVRCELVALDLSTSRELWRDPFACHSDGDTAASDGLFIAINGTRVSAWDARNGAKAWTVDIPTLMGFGSRPSDLTSDGGRIYVAVDYNYDDETGQSMFKQHLASLRAADGALMWQKMTEPPRACRCYGSTATQLVADEGLVGIYDFRDLTMLNEAGTVLWSRGFGYPLMADNRLVEVWQRWEGADFGGVDPATGISIWQETLGHTGNAIGDLSADLLTMDLYYTETLPAGGLYAFGKDRLSPVWDAARTLTGVVNDLLHLEICVPMVRDLNPTRTVVRLSENGPDGPWQEVVGKPIAGKEGCVEVDGYEAAQDVWLQALPIDRAGNVGLASEVLGLPWPKSPQPEPTRAPVPPPSVPGETAVPSDDGKSAKIPLPSTGNHSQTVPVTPTPETVSSTDPAKGSPEPPLAKQPDPAALREEPIDVAAAQVVEPAVPRKGKSPQSPPVAEPEALRIEAHVVQGEVQGTIRAPDEGIEGLRLDIVDDAGLNLVVDIPESATPNSDVPFSIRVAGPKDSSGPSVREVAFRAAGREVASEVQRLRVQVTQSDLVRGGSDHLGAIAAFATVSFLAAAAALFEPARYRITWAFMAVPLFSRILKPRMLEQPTRERVYECIMESPGIHYRALHKTLGLGQGALSYHLRKLESADLIKSKREGRRLRFFSTQPRQPTFEAYVDPVGRVLRLVQASPGLWTAELGRRLGLTRQTIGHHLRTLAARGAVRIEDNGRLRLAFAT